MTWLRSARAAHACLQCFPEGTTCGRDTLRAWWPWHPAAFQEPPAPNTGIVLADSWGFWVCTGHWPSPGGALVCGSSAAQSSSVAGQGGPALWTALCGCCCPQSPSPNVPCWAHQCIPVGIAGETQLCLKHGQFFLIEITLVSRVCVDMLRSNHNDCLQSTYFHCKFMGLFCLNTWSVFFIYMHFACYSYGLIGRKWKIGFPKNVKILHLANSLHFPEWEQK